MRLIFIILLSFSISAKGQAIFHANNQTPASFLLDTYTGAAAAYSLRKIRSGYTGFCINVRRSSDDTNMDIGFVSDYIDTATMKTFVGAGNGVVWTWYDQSTNANNAKGSLHGAIIITAGVVERQNGLVTLRFDPLIPSYYSINTPITSQSNWGVFIVNKRKSAGRNGLFVCNDPGSMFVGQYLDNNFYLDRTVSAGSGFYKFAADATATFILLEGHNSSNVISAYKNNVAYSLSAEMAYSPAANIIGYIGDHNGQVSDANGSEVIIWGTDQTANRSGIASNINSFYTIY